MREKYISLLIFYQHILLEMREKDIPTTARLFITKFSQKSVNYLHLLKS